MAATCRPTRSSSASASAQPRARRRAGLAAGNGVRVDAQLRSSNPDIYAAGDVANAFHPLLGKHIRVEHWANALNQPQAAAKAMPGQQVSYDRVPYFFSDQYDLGMEYSGYVEPEGYHEVVFRGDVGRREFVAFWLGEGGEVLAGMNVNVWDVTEPIQALVRAPKPVDKNALRDPGTSLESLPASDLHHGRAPASTAPRARKKRQRRWRPCACRESRPSL